jgi:UDP-N-acetylglucosamine--N-acetylmuramyl-(pentapeptide) pyrophosphoryl-undecaprenol N-acetylglucosamine transferase
LELINEKVSNIGKSRLSRIIIAGGGTGGHIFPAIAIANALREILPGCEVLFVGAKGKMEMQKVPEAGYKIEGIDIAGFNRSSLIRNLGLPVKLLQSFWQVHSICSRFRPDAVVGVGGYASFPVLRYAQWRGIPTFIHEANSIAGKSNRMLAKRAVCVFTGTDDMEKFFPPGKVLHTGNPVRQQLVAAQISREEGARSFGLEPSVKTLLVTGGSLGAKGINEAVAASIQLLKGKEIQLIWQTGTSYADKARSLCESNKSCWTGPFIQSMAHAYAAADLVVSRAGAMTIAELCITGKPAVFVPYPFAAEDHQTVNAMNLVEKGAALLVKDKEAAEKLIPMVIELLENDTALNEMKDKIKRTAMPDADNKIAHAIIHYFEN